MAKKGFDRKKGYKKVKYGLILTVLLSALLSATPVLAQNADAKMLESLSTGISAIRNHSRTIMEPRILRRNNGCFPVIILSRKDARPPKCQERFHAIDYIWSLAAFLRKGRNNRSFSRCGSAALREIHFKRINYKVYVTNRLSWLSVVLLYIRERLKILITNKTCWDASALSLEKIPC